MQPSRILFIRTDSIGDNVLASSMLPHLRERFPEAEITVVCQEHIAELYENSPCVDAIITFNKKMALQNEEYLLSLPDKLKNSRADLALNTVYSREPLNDFLSICSGAAIRIAFNGNLCNISGDHRDKNNSGYTHLISSNNSEISELERHREFLQGIGIQAPPLTPIVWTTREDEDSAARFFYDNYLQPEKTIALFPCAQWDVKLYPKYGEALAAVMQKGAYKVLGLGTKENSEIIQKQLEQLGVTTFNLSGATTLRQTAAILRRCQLAVGADSASAHLACAVQTPNVVVLGGGHFGRFFPYSPLTSVVCLPLSCYNCNWQCSYPIPYCIKNIHPKVLAHAVIEALEKSSEKPRVYIQDRQTSPTPPSGPFWRHVSGILPSGSVELVPCSYSGALTETRTLRTDEFYPCFSVITPSFNQAHYIEQTIQSVLAQNYPYFEHIVIDGGSSDGTLEILKSYRHLKWSSEKDNGQSDAINKGFRIASGDIIAWINSDDWYEPGAFKAIADFFQANPEKNVVMGDCNLVNEHGIIFDRVINHERGFAELKKYWVSRSIPTQPAVFFRRNLLNEFGLLDEALHYTMDYDLWMRFAQKNRFYHLDMTVANYRFHSNAKGGDQDWSKFLPDCRVVHDRYSPPVVSVIIPCYNYGHYLEEAVHSVLAQSYQEFELIIVNDGSTDTTASIAEQLIASHQHIRIRLINQDNSGQPAAARNRGISEAKGKYILPLDADDKIAPTFIEKMVDILDNYKAVDIVYCDTIRFGDVDDAYQTGEWNPQRLASVNTLNYCALFRRNVWKDVGGYRLNCGYEDWEFWISAAEKGFRGYRIPEHLFYYRIKKSGRLLIDQQNDALNKAKIALYHPNLYNKETLAWAEEILFRQPTIGNNLHILFVVHNFPPNWFAGVENYSYQLAKTLNGHGIKISVLYSEHRDGIPVPTLEEGSYEGIQVYKLVSDYNAPKHSDISTQIAHQGKEQLFSDFLQQHQFDVIHFHHTKGMPFSFIQIARENKFPVCATLHDFWFLCVNVHLYDPTTNTPCQGPHNLERCVNCLRSKIRYQVSAEEAEILYKWIQFRISYAMKILQDVDGIVSPSRYLAAIYHQFGISKHIEISPLGLNNIKHSSRKTASPIVFGYLGVIHDLKNVYMLIEAFKETAGEAHLMFFGNGADFHIKKLVSSICGCERISYKGEYLPAQLPEILDQVDIVVLPSLTENYPLVIREAFSAGIPVIASRVGGIPEIVTHLLDGILFNPQDKQELKNWLQILIDKTSLIEELKKNIKAVKSMEQDAMEWVSRYSLFVEKGKSAQA